MPLPKSIPRNHPLRLHTDNPELWVEVVEKALVAADGYQGRAAELLGVGLSTLKEWLVERPAFASVLPDGLRAKGQPRKAPTKAEVLETRRKRAAARMAARRAKGEA